MSDTAKKTIASVNASSAQNTESMLLQRLASASSEDERFRWMLFTVGYYRGVEKIDAAKELLVAFLAQSNDPDHHVQCQLALGQIATDEAKLHSAISHFSAALDLKPASKKIAYILENNLGYCCNALERYHEGEKHCRAALDINGSRPSAYRNLGISFLGQGKPASAGWALLEAIKTDNADDRARELLKKLVSEHPSLPVHCPWIIEGLALTDGLANRAPLAV